MNSFNEINEYIKFLEISKSQHTVRLYTWAIDKFFRFANIKDLNDLKTVTSSKCMDFQFFLRDNGTQPNTINTSTRILKAMYHWFVAKRKYLSYNPLVDIEEMNVTKNKSVQYLSEQEEAQLINACHKLQDRLMILMMLTLGLRRDEVCGLLVKNISNQHIKIIGKGNKERNLIIQSETYELLKKHLETRTHKDSPYIFVSHYGTQFSGDGVYKKIKSIAEAAEIDPERIELIHPHTLRHTFATNLIDVGTPLNVVQTALGHASVTTTQIYAHVRDSTVDRALIGQKSIYGN